MVTITTQKTTAPKNHSALDPISPRLKMMNQTIARVPATPQANHQTPRQPNRCGTAIGAGCAPLTSLRSESSAALVDCLVRSSRPPFIRTCGHAGSA